jgi:hypothetical protein
MKKGTLENFKKDKLYPRIVRATHEILQEKNFVTPIDALLKMQLLDARSVEGWRFGRIPYLERAIRCNLAQASRILRILRMHAHDLNLKPSQTAYKQWGKGKSRTLQFTKTGDRNLEAAYSRHFVRLGALFTAEGAEVRRGKDGDKPLANSSDRCTEPSVAVAE